MLSIRSTIVASLNNAAPDYAGIRENIGRYLHLLQNFYSNTNWVELYPDDLILNTDLGRLFFFIVCNGVKNKHAPEFKSIRLHFCNYIRTLR